MIRGKNFIVNLAVYPFDVMVSYMETDSTLLKSLNQYFDEESINELNILSLPYNCKARVSRISGGQTILRIPNKIITPFEKGCLAHEIFHVVDLIFDEIGISLTKSSNESYAYLIGYLTEQIYKEL